MKLKFLILTCLCVGSLTLFSQQDNYITIINVDEIRSTLQNATLAKSLPVKQSKIVVNLPLPDGTSQHFKVVESPIFDKSLSTTFPDIHSYLIEGVDNPAFHGRLSMSPNKMTAAFYTTDGIAFVEPTEVGATLYKSYYRDGKGKDFECGFGAKFSNEEIPNQKSSANLFSNGTLLRTYDMIIATTGEFYQANGNSNTAVAAEVNSIMSGMNVFYENEVSIHFNIVAINLLSNPNTDGLNPVGNRTADADDVIDDYAVANNINYDIGHVVHTTASGGSGIAGPGPCSNFGKARAWSGLSAGSSVYTWVNLMGHEIGHQFGAAHSFYGTEGNCGARSAGDGYEPGSGSTVMSYEGICGSQNITPAPNTNYFHVHSLDQIVNYASNITCGTTSSTGNAIPTVTSMPPSITIPKGTPFYLKGSATDADGNPLTYCWEQYDTDNISYGQNSTAGIPANAANSTTAPLFRSFDPSPNGHERFFPQLSDIIAGTTTQGEILPAVARTLTMRMTVRDNVVGGGAFVYDAVTLNVNATGPFTVSAPNGGETFIAGNNHTVSWNVAGTSAFCSTIDILLSVDGGFNYPYTLAANISNSGSASVTIPAGVTNSNIARMMVRCSDNPDAYFFDMSNDDFTISSDCLAPSNIFTNTSATTYNQGQTINLNVTPSYLGTTITGYTGSSFSFRSIGINDNSGTGCTMINTNSDLLQFTVDATGTYTVAQNPFFCGFSLFDGVSTTCANFLGSSLNDNGGGSIGITSGSVSATLIAGNTYTLAVTNFFNSTTVAISGPGSALTIGSLPPNYAYSYLAVDQSTGMVVAVNAGANFTGINGGVYDIYGFAYENDGTNSTAPPDVNPSSFIGQTIASILSGGSCVNYSNNTEVLTVVGSSACPTAYNVSGNENGSGNGSSGQNTGDYETDGTITSTQTITGGTVDYDSGTYIQLNPGFNTIIGANFHAFIDGCGGAMKPTGTDHQLIKNENNKEAQKTSKNQRD